MKKNYFFVAILIVIAILSTFVLFACTDADTNLNDIVSEKSTKQTETQNTQKNNNQQSSNIDEDEDDSLDNGKQSSNIDDPNTQQGNTQQGNTQVGNDPQQPSIDNDPNNQQGNVDNNPNDQQSNTDNNGTTDTNPQQGNEGGGGNVNPQPQPTYVDMNVPSVGLAFADNVDGNTVSLVGIGTCEDTIIRVPASVDDKKVTRIAKDAFKGNEEITKVKLLGNVEVIEEGAFALCIKLETFYGNSDLDLVKIEDEAFYGDTELSYIPLCAYKIKEIGRNVFVGTNFYNTASNWYDDALYLQSYLIAVKPDCTGISLNYDTSAIAADAFKGCSLLPSLRISKNIVLSAGLLEDCISLTELQLHSIGSANENTAKLSYLFGEPENKDNCVLVDGAYIPKSLTTIAVLSGNVGQEAFKDCTFIKEVYASGEIIGNNAFNNCTGLREIYLGSATKTIGQYAFYGCTSLVRINFYKKLESIGQYAFYGCESLRQIVLPENLESIGNYAFSECTKLTSVTLPTTLQIIGMKAFYNCDCLIEVCNLSALEIEKGQSDCGYVGYYAYDIYTTKTYTSKFEYSHDCLLYKKGTNDYEFIRGVCSIWCNKHESDSIAWS